MGLLHPAALLSLLAVVPALVLAYLARERPVRLTVSSVLAFRALRGPRAERFRGRPRFNWMFFVELLILVLAVLAIARPYMTARQRPIAAVLDNSAAMQARLESGQTRFEAARAQLSAALGREGGGGEVTLYVTAPAPHRIADSFASIAEARAALQSIELTDAPDDPQALARTLGELASGARFTRVLFAGDNPIAAPLPSNLRVIAVGSPIANYAIGSFLLRRESFGAATLHARVTVANFSPAAQTLRVSISGDGRPLGSANARLDSGEVGSLEFPSLAPAELYRADLKPDDGFPLDNVAYAAAGAVKSFAILFVSPTPADAGGLSSIPGVTVRTRLPAQFTPDDLASADLVIFEYALPKKIPPVNALLVMPPPGDGLFDFATATADPVRISGWRTPDPLTDSVNFRLLNLRRGEYFASHPWMAPIVSGNLGGLLLAGGRQGHRFVATGFDPFPYLGKQNLPMSVLTLNMLSYLAGLSTETIGYRTGQPWLVPAGVRKIVLPSGREVPVEPGTLFSDDTAQGVYQLVGSEPSGSARAINLSDLRCSDLEDLPSLKLEVPARTSQRTFTHAAPLDGYLLAAIVILALAEALGAYRRRRTPLQAES